MKTETTVVQRDDSKCLQVKGKGKAIPLQAWTGLECCRMLRLLDFQTVST